MKKIKMTIFFGFHDNVVEFPDPECFIYIIKKNWVSLQRSADIQTSINQMMTSNKFLIVFKPAEDCGLNQNFIECVKKYISRLELFDIFIEPNPTT